MSANLIRNQTRNRQPIQGTGIRHGHRLAKGLVFASTGSVGFFDFVSNTFPNSKSGATVGVMQRGRTASPAAGSGQIAWPAGSTGLDKVTGPGTLLVCMRSNNNGGNWRSFGSREDNNTGDGVYLLYDDNANVTNGFNAGGNNNNYRANSNSNALGTNSEQSFHTFGFSWDGTGIQTYADGKPDKLTTGGFATFTPNANSSRITRIQSGSAQSDFLFAYAWNRVLTAAEIAEITANPWQIFSAANQPLYADAIAAGGTTLSPGSGHLTLTGSQPTIGQTTTLALTAGTGHLALTGKQPSIAQGSNASLSAGAGHLALTGYAPSVSQTQNQSVAALSGHLAFAGKQPSISQTANLSLAPAAGHLLLTGKQPGVTQSLVTGVSPGAGHLVLTGKQPSIAQTANQSLTPGAGHARFTGYAPTITGPEFYVSGYHGGGGLSRSYVEQQWELLELRKSNQRINLKPIPKAAKPSKTAPTSVAVVPMPMVGDVSPAAVPTIPTHMARSSPVMDQIQPVPVPMVKPITIAIAANDDADDEAALLAILEVI